MISHDGSVSSTQLTKNYTPYQQVNEIVHWDHGYLSLNDWWLWGCHERSLFFHIFKVWSAMMAVFRLTHNRELYSLSASQWHCVLRSWLLELKGLVLIRVPFFVARSVQLVFPHRFVLYLFPVSYYALFCNRADSQWWDCQPNIVATSQLDSKFKWPDMVLFSIRDSLIHSK